MSGARVQWLNIFDNIMFNNDEKKGKNIFRPCFGDLLHSDHGTETADCFFDVGQGDKKQKFRCHRLILSAASPVFHAMLYGAMAEKNDNHHLIPVPDIDADVFAMFLQLIYTGTLPPLENFEHITKVWLCVDKYLVAPSAIKASFLDQIDPELLINNAFQLFEFAKVHGFTNLEQTTLKVLIDETAPALRSDSFLTIQWSTLLEIFSQDVLHCSEIDLWNALLKYASKNEIKMFGKGPSKKGRTVNITRALKRIRFLSMHVKEFLEGPCKQALLTEIEKLGILMCLIDGELVPDKYPDGFQIKKRKGFVSYWNPRYQSEDEVSCFG